MSEDKSITPLPAAPTLQENHDAVAAAQSMHGPSRYAEVLALGAHKTHKKARPNFESESPPEDNSLLDHVLIERPSIPAKRIDLPQFPTGAANASFTVDEGFSVKDYRNRDGLLAYYLATKPGNKDCCIALRRFPQPKHAEDQAHFVGCNGNLPIREVFDLAFAPTSHTVAATGNVPLTMLYRDRGKGKPQAGGEKLPHPGLSTVG